MRCWHWQVHVPKIWFASMHTCHVSGILAEQFSWISLKSVSVSYILLEIKFNHSCDVYQLYYTKVSFLLRPSSFMNGNFCPSVRLSVRPSVTPFGLCSHHCIITKFLGVIPKDQGKAHAKGQGQRSKVKVTEFTTQLNRFRTVTPVWIHIWWCNDTYGLMLLSRGALSFIEGHPSNFKVIRL